MQLKPQDVLVLLKLVSWRDHSWTYAELAMALDMSPSQAHAGARRAVTAQLGIRDERGIRPQLRNLAEFLAHGIRYVFVPERGEPTRGVPTAHAAAPLKDLLQQGSEPPPVWPHPDGEVRGAAFSPLFRSAPDAARADPLLHELLALVDGIRGGRARERQLAIGELRKRLEVDHPSR